MAAQESFIDFMTKYAAVFGVTGMTSKVHALQHVLDDCRTQDSHLDYNSVYDFESEQQQWGKGKFIRSGNKVLEQITCVPNQVHFYIYLFIFTIYYCYTVIIYYTLQFNIVYESCIII
jgi:hypothetical protein